MTLMKMSSLRFGQCYRACKLSYERERTVPGGEGVGGGGADIVSDGEWLSVPALSVAVKTDTSYWVLGSRSEMTV